MSEYHKIQTIWKRESAKPCPIIVGEFATPELAALADLDWTWEEKIDGTNVRVEWDGADVTFKGKTDRAQMPPFLLARLEAMFPPALFEKAFDGPATLYGEGYGARIQKGGGNYNPDGVDFVLFDVHCGGLWLRRESVNDVADNLGITVVPRVGSGTLWEASNDVQRGFHSEWGEFTAEGLVLRPPVELHDRRGNRIIAKIKHKDFAHLPSLETASA